jgi:putative spermidine/putrescine transport system substrate-binding protein
MISRLLLPLAVLLAGLTPVAARDLTVISWGGNFQDAQRKAYFAPFTTETGLKVVDDSWEGGVGALRSRAEAAGDPGWDVVHVEIEELQLGSAEGLFEPIDWSKIAARDELIPSAHNKFGVGAITWSAGVAYDADKYKSGPSPSTVADFFDVRKFPGKRAIRKGPKYALELALIGNGVPVADVYKVLSTPEGVDRAFKKLSTIKKDLIFFESGGQAIQLLASGEASLVLAFNGRVTAANQSDKRNFRFIWPGSIYALDNWVILKNSPNKEAALKFIDFASRAKQQEILPQFVAYGPTNTVATAALPENVVKELPTYPKNLVGALQVDAAFWTENIEPLTERFNAFAAQ